VQGVGIRLFALFSAEGRLAKLSVLVALFAMLMIARAAIIAVRDITIAQLELDYVQLVRSRITRRLAAARWDTILRLRHSRIVHVMGAGIQQLYSATYVVLHGAVAVIMLMGQIVLAFLLAPRLAAVAFGLVLLGTAALLPTIRRARRIGGRIVEANVSLIDDVSKFLSALKLSISQNLQQGFIHEFDATLGDLKTEQIGYVRQQTISRLVVTICSGFAVVAFVLLGIVIFDISPSVLITLLLIVSRMSGPGGQLQLQCSNWQIPCPPTKKSANWKAIWSQLSRERRPLLPWALLVLFPKVRSA
jgi:ABC-type multidrug transport system fused ATPase/permease subunit